DVLAAPSLRMGLSTLPLPKDTALGSQKAPVCQPARTLAQGDPVLAAKGTPPTRGHKRSRLANSLLAQFAPPPRQLPCRPSSPGSFRRHVSTPVRDRGHPR